MKFYKLLPWLILFALLTLWRSDPAFVQVLRLKAFDVLQQTFPREIPADFPVYVVDIDEKSLDVAGQWPWPRTVIAKLIENSFDAGAKAVAFDVLFAEADRTSPENALQHWQVADWVAQEIQNLPKHDHILAQTLENKPVVLGYTLNPLGKTPKEDDFDLYSDVTGTKLERAQVPTVPAMIRNRPELEESAPAMGWFGYIPELDNIIRRVPLLVRYKETLYAPLALKLLRAASGGGLLTPVFDNLDDLKGIKVSQYHLPTDESGRYWLRFRPHTRANYISAADVLNQTPAAKVLENKMVLVGTSAQGLLDMRTTPLDPDIPGVDVHVQVIETILEQSFLQRPVWLSQAEWLLTALSGTLLILCIAWLGAFAGAGLVISSIAASLGLSAWLFLEHKWLVDPVLPVLTFFALYFVQVIVKYAQEESAKSVVRDAFSRYLSPEMVKIVSREPDKLKLGGEQKEMTLFFSDIRSFTTISERMTPEQLTSFINAYLTPMTNIITAHQGTVDKYIGDAVMAFWNAPVDVETHAEKACQAALDMQAELQKLNTEWQQQGLPFMAVGMGLNTGVVNVGNMGAEQRFNYTVMGDAVNTAARLESSTKFYGVDILASEYTKKHVPNAVWLPLDYVIVKGKTKPLEVFELVAMCSEHLPPERIADMQAIQSGIAAFRSRKWAMAKKAFVLLSPRYETLKALYLGRIETFQKSPPPKNWNGAVERRSK